MELGQAEDISRVNPWAYQWERFSETADTETFRQFIFPTRLEDYSGKVVLDAGCGNAGYAKLVSRYALRVVGVDKYSAAVARRSVAGYGNVEIVHGDIETMDLGEQYDMIYSVGVLQHLERPEVGFRNLARHLTPGGVLNIWVYSREGNAPSILLFEPLKRILLRRLPRRALKALAHFCLGSLLVLAHSVYRLPLPLPYRRYFQHFRAQSYSRQLMKVFDKLNAPVTHWFRREDVARWFHDDFEEVALRHHLGMSWAGRGRKRQTQTGGQEENGG
jgi:SAM-dependent methyltransferase